MVLKNGKKMSYTINVDINLDDVMGNLNGFDKEDFVYECYEYLSFDYRTIFLQEIGVTEIVERLGDKALIKELEMRGYKITQDGSEDI